jgi:DNA (cytosine-5)-methyltransferase 1
MRVVDLCSGTGAFSYVFEKYGYECVFSNDIISESKEIYQLNIKSHENFILDDLHNIKTESIPPHDILCAGFPCQSFSIAGERKGFMDERSNVFWKIIDILQFCKPNIIILENVKNLVSHDKNNTFRIIKQSLENIGYSIKFSILDTCKITNIPHHRERIYIVGFLDKSIYDKFNFEFEHTLNNCVNSFLEKNVADKYYYTKKLKVYDEVKRNIVKHVKTGTVYQYRRYYIRENKNKCCPTLTANMGSGGHNVPLIKDDIGIRKLTPRECFNLQGFPENYQLPNLSDSKLYKLSGNAVSIPVIEKIIIKLKNIMKN